MRKFLTAALIAVALTLSGFSLSGCNTASTLHLPQSSADMHQLLLKSIVTANGTLATAEAGIRAAVQTGAIQPNSATAVAIHDALVKARGYLDEAAAAWRANDDATAQAKLDQANEQLPADAASPMPGVVPLDRAPPAATP
jgi:hypothetical protein